MEEGFDDRQGGSAGSPGARGPDDGCRQVYCRPVVVGVELACTNFSILSI